MEKKEQLSMMSFIVRETSPLASIQKVHSPVAIDGRDQIVTATVLGYRVIVKKSDFFPDFDLNKESSSSSFSLCVFVQPDSLMDESNPRYTFLDSKRKRLVCTKKNLWYL